MADNFDVIVIGGGIVGASIAYHLGVQGKQAVCLLERGTLTCGTTWHAAGLVAELRATANLTRLAKYSAELYDSLEASGRPVGYRRVGALTLALTAARRHELLRQAAMARSFGVECQWLSPAEIAERWPQLLVADSVGGLYMPRDGQTNPVDTTLALAGAASDAGVEVREHCAVETLRAEGGRVVGVQVAGDLLKASKVVLAAGLWTRTLAMGVGAEVPLYPCEHSYAVTDPVAAAQGAPIVRVPDQAVYLKPDAGRMLIGCFEQRAKPIDPQQLGADFSFAELPFDLEHFAPYLEAGLGRYPEMVDAGIRTWFNGPEAFTPDGRYVLGETAQVANLFVAAGFNSIGIQSAGGVGRVMAQWLESGRPPMDLWDVDVRRFTTLHNHQAYLVDRCSESLGLLYAMHWPYRQYESARNRCLSPLYEKTRERGACFGELAGWERPNWYARPGQAARYEYSFDRQNWFDNAAAEHAAVRADVALFDQTSFAKFRVSGRDACRFLNRLCTADVDVAVGRVVYCQCLNAHGGIEADVTITRLAWDDYWYVTAAPCRVRDWTWLGKHRGGFAVHLEDITELFAVLGLMGPRSRSLLARVSGADLGNEAFAFATSRVMEIAGAPVRATRISYVGSLGWELYIPWSQACDVFDALVLAAGANLPMAGYHAMDSLRLEKANRHWGHDLTDETTPLEAGLGFTVSWNKAGGFLGREALLAQRSRGLDKRLLLFALENPQVLLYGDEPVWIDGQRAGHITSAAFGHSIGRAVGFGYVHAKAMAQAGLRLQELQRCRIEIEVAERRWPAGCSHRALYDPDNLQMRA